jgi:hypothetical protein
VEIQEAVTAAQSQKNTQSFLLCEERSAVHAFAWTSTAPMLLVM